MKKRLAKKFLAFIVCAIMCVTLTNQAFAADIPYANIQTVGSAAASKTINTASFSGYSSTSIGHFTIETTGYASDTTISIVIYYGSNQVSYYLQTGNGKVSDIGFNQNFYYPAGNYKIVVTAYGSDTSGWTGVWLYH